MRIQRFGLLVAACAAMIFVATAPAEAQQRKQSYTKTSQYQVGVPVPPPPGMQTYEVPSGAGPYTEVPVSGNYCARSPAPFTCHERIPPVETCFTVCMTPDEWELCPTKSWYASGYDNVTTAPPNATPKNSIRFYERCATVCRPMGTPRLAYWYYPRPMLDGTWHPGRWLTFPFSPSRNASR